MNIWDLFMKKVVSEEEIVIATMPFSKELMQWCQAHADFMESLKNVHLRKFISLGAIVTSYPTNNPQDQVIGVYTYHYQRKNPIFKQDFIVNLGNRNKEFILYTRSKNGKKSKYVKDINDFYMKYGNTGDYVNSHHLTFNQLPGEIRPRAEHAINLARKIFATGAVQKTSKKFRYKLMQKIKKVGNHPYSSELKPK